MSARARRTRLSKGMSYLLRHGAEKERIPMEASGFMLVDDVLAFARMLLAGDRKSVV